MTKPTSDNRFEDKRDIEQILVHADGEFAVGGPGGSKEAGRAKGPSKSYVSPPQPEMERETILEEADRIVSNERGDAYGHPLIDFSRTALIWTAILGAEVSPQQVGLCMIGLKLSRETNGHRRDNLVDVAGYAKTIAMIEDALEEGIDVG